MPILKMNAQYFTNIKQTQFENECFSNSIFEIFYNRQICQ